MCASALIGDAECPADTDWSRGPCFEMGQCGPPAQYGKARHDICIQDSVRMKHGSGFESAPRCDVSAGLRVSSINRAIPALGTLRMVSASTCCHIPLPSTPAHVHRPTADAPAPPHVLSEDLLGCIPLLGQAALVHSAKPRQGCRLHAPVGQHCMSYIVSSRTSCLAASRRACTQTGHMQVYMHPGQPGSGRVGREPTRRSGRCCRASVWMDFASFGNCWLLSMVCLLLLGLLRLLSRGFDTVILPLAP